MHEVNRSVVFAGLVSLACAGVSANEEGNLSADKTGSIIAPLALRGASDAQLLRRCGDGAPSEAGKLALTRLPFLQQVTSQSALVVFRTMDQEPLEVQITTLDGEPIATVAAETDATVADGSQKVATLSGLQDATTYCYLLPGLTAPAGFRTAPMADGRSPVRFLAFGDSGWGGSDQAALFKELMTVPFDLVIHTGDLAYDQGTEGQIDRTVFKEYASMLRSFPMYPASGNHEYETADAAPFEHSFILPDNGVPRQSEHWYSFDWGDVHFAALNTEQIGAEQADWLDADLRVNQRPWTVVFAHRPPYSSGEHGGNAAFVKFFVPVFERYKVPLVLSGHDHDYERSKVLNGVTYVVTGGGGRGTRPVGSSSFTAFSDAVIHFVFVEIAGSRLVLHAIDGVGREFDQALIDQGGSTGPISDVRTPSE